MTRPVCEHRGKHRGKLNGAIDVFACGPRGECTVETPFGAMACCAACPLYLPPGVPHVDVVITSHNYGEYLAEAIESVLAQTDAKIGSILVVDDASDDDTREVAERYAPRVGYLRVEVRDAHKARGAGVAETRKQRHDSSVAHLGLICFLDADNIHAPHYLRTAQLLFAADPELAIVYCDLEKFGTRSIPHVTPETFSESQLAAMNFVDSGSVWSREALAQSVTWGDSPHAHDDWLMARQILSGGNWRAAKNPVALKYRTHDRQLSTPKIPRTYWDRIGMDAETVTVFTTFSARVAKSPELWQRRRDWLLAQAWPRSQVRVVVANTSHQPAPADLFSGLEGFAGLSVYDHPVGRAPGLEDVNRQNRAVEQDVQTAVAAIYNRMLREVAGEWCLILEDDVFPQRLDAIAQLLRGFDSDTASVSGAYQQRYCPFDWTVWKKLNTHLEHQRGRGLQPVAGNGFGCLLLRLTRCRDIVITGNTFVASYYDTDFYERLRLRGLTFKVDWSVECDHVGERIDCVEPPPRAAVALKPPAPAPVSGGPCVHRSADSRVEKCDLCGGGRRKGTPFAVFHCAKHDVDCSLSRLHSAVRSCGLCQALGEDR